MDTHDNEQPDEQAALAYLVRLGKPPYKHSRNGWYTAPLFREQWGTVPDDKKNIWPKFRLYGSVQNEEDLISCEDTFVEIGDPTGYMWAEKYLGTYDHFRYLMDKCSWFREAYSTWLDTLKTKLIAESIYKIREIATSESPQALVAAKYLAGIEWENKNKGDGSKRGRPSKEEVKGELKKQVKILEEEAQDMERIGLKIITGGKE